MARFGESALGHGVAGGFSHQSAGKRALGGDRGTFPEKTIDGGCVDPPPAARFLAAREAPCLHEAQNALSGDA